MQKIRILSALLTFALVLSFIRSGHHNDLPREDAGRAMDNEGIDNDWFITQRTYPGSQLPRNVVQRMKGEMTKFAARNQAHDVVHSGTWNLVGPSNIGGRINALAIDPTDPNTIYAGAASGGIWKSTDLGATWNNIFNESFSTGAVTIDPSDHNVIYVGTGENGPGGVATYPGNGVWRSSDAGATWSNIGLTQTGYTGRVIVNPLNPNELYVAAIGLYRDKTTERGVYKTTNLGATWTQALYLNDTTGAVDVMMDPADTSRIFAAMWTRYRTIHSSVITGPASGMYFSSNGGTNWSLVTNGFPNNSATMGRISFNFAPSNHSIVYATVAVNTGWGGTYKSTDRGVSWAKTFDGTSLNEGQTWYNNVTTVDPNNANHVWVGMTPLYASTAGGSAFTNASFSGASHPDYHAIEYAPSNPSIMVIGCDGGIFTSTDAGSSWAKSFNLPISQFYAGAVSAQNPNRFLGGLQDNNSVQVLNGAQDQWYAIYGGDGFYCLIDPTDSNYVYAEYQYGVLGYSTNGGNSFTYGATSGINGADRHNWEQPIAMDVLNPKTLYTGTQSVYMTTNNMQSWTAISGDLTHGNGGRVGTISTIDVADSDPSVIYVGTDDGRVWVTTDQGSNWTEIGTSLPGRWVTRVSADPNSAAICYVTLSGFYENDFGSHVYRTTDYGSTWSNIGSTLPDVPANDIVVDPSDPNTLYLATDLNVCYTTNLGATWSVLGTNLPSVPVHDLEIHTYPGKTQLTAFTHGRSAFTYDIQPVVSSGVTLSINPKWNLVSSPFSPANDSVHALFANALGPAYAYTGTGYNASAVVEHKTGYWLKFPNTSGQTVSFSGTPADDETLAVAAGWNLIGSAGTDIPVSAITANGTALVSSFYGYKSGYIVADSIKAGHAYWIRVDHAGSLTLNTTGTTPKTSTTAASKPVSLTIEVRDASGNSQFLGVSEPGEASTSYAPPLPPTGAFDARFASQKFIEAVDVRGISVPIVISGAEYPVTISWSSSSRTISTSLTVGGKYIKMEGEGSVLLTSEQDHAVLVSGAQKNLPQKFFLAQNFPNPFNPSTSIRYALPSDSRVSLVVFNALGQQVAELVNAEQVAGEHDVQFDASNLSSGVYYYRLTASDFTQTRKLLLLR